MLRRRFALVLGVLTFGWLAADTQVAQAVEPMYKSKVTIAPVTKPVSYSQPILRLESAEGAPMPKAEPGPMGGAVTTQPVYTDDGHGSSHCGPIGYVDYLYLRPRLDNLDFAAIAPDGTANPDSASVQSLTLDRQSGIRFGFGWGWDNGMDIMGGFMALASNDSANLLAPPGGTLLALRENPNDGADQALSALAQTSLELDVWDVEVGYRCGNDTLSARIFAGYRYANIRHDMTIIYNGQDFAVPQANAITVSMKGHGLRFGGRATWNIAGGLILQGHAAFGALVGDFDTTLANFDLAPVVGDIDANLQDAFVQFVPVIETSLAVGWQRGNFSVLAGYELTNYFSFAQRTQFADDTQDALLTRSTGNLGLEGLFVRLGWNY